MTGAAKRGPAARRRAWRHGRRAEALCVWSLRLRGYRILARGFRAPVGEIDIIARRGDLLVLIEVKARSSLAEAAEAVTPRQRLRIRRAAELYLARHPALARLSVRFDAMLLTPWRPPVHVVDAWRD